MKREIAIFIFVFFICSASAITTDLAENYKQKQTAIVKIEGNILQEIQNSQVKIKKGNSFVAFEYGLKKIDDLDYLWFVTPAVEGSYKLILENINAVENGQNQIVNYEKDFYVTNQMEDYYVKPGVITASANFFVSVINSKDTTQQINVEFPNRQINLIPGETKVNFYINEFSGTQNIDLNVGKYKIPSKIYGIEIQNQTNSTNNNSTNGSVINGTTQNQTIINASINNTQTANVSGNISFDFLSPVIKANLSNSSTNVSVKFRIKNTGDVRIENLKFIFNEEYFDVNFSNRSILPNETADFELKIKKAPNKYYRDAVVAEFGGYNKYMLVLVEVSNRVESPKIEYVPQEQVNSFYYCREIDKDAKICDGNQTCSGNEVSSLDGDCCIGTCESESQSSGSSWIGYLIAILLIIVVGYVFLKYKKVNSNKESAVKDKFVLAEKKLP